MHTALPKTPKGWLRTSQRLAANRTTTMQRMLLAWLIMFLPLLQPQTATAEIFIGIATPANGPGAEIRRAAKVSAERINAEGGVLGELISLIEADDGCNSEQGSKAAQSLVDRRVAVVIGHPCGSSANAAGHIYAANSVVLLGITRHPALTEKRAGEVIFRVAGRDDSQGASAAAYFSRKFRDKPIAIVRDASRYARRITNDLRAALKRAGFTEAMSAAVWGGQKDYSKLIAKLQAANTHALFFAGFPLEAGLLLRQLRSAGLSTVFVGTETLASAQFADTAGSAASGARILLPHDPTRKLAASGIEHQGVERPATGPFLNTFAAFEAWRAAVRQEGSIRPNAVSAALKRGTFETVLGYVSFAESGDANLPAYDIVTWKNDAWRTID